MAKKKRGGGRKIKKSSKVDKSDEDLSDSDFFGLDDFVNLPTWNYDLKHQCTTPAFEHPELIEHMHGKDLTNEYLMESGLRRPILMDTEEGLGMRVPARDGSFTIDDIKRGVGSMTTFDVVEVATQSSRQMTMGEFADYYKKRTSGESRDKTLYNCLSLEFTEKKLCKQVIQPEFTKDIDWVFNSWPEDSRHIVQVPISSPQHAQPTSSSSSSSTSIIPDPIGLEVEREEEDEEEEEKEAEEGGQQQKFITHVPYPKVQHYCLMSVSECYTDFHLDFGGTSVWYHITKGEKVFWLVPPSPQNLRVFEEWQKDEQGSFFAELADICHRIVLKPGNTFIIPSGWIHAVYTPKDSIVFGGNFLHSFAIETQLKVYEMENRTKVFKKFRYPFFHEIHWYTAARYVEEMIPGHRYAQGPGEPLNDHLTGFIKRRKERKKLQDDLELLEFGGLLNDAKLEELEEEDDGVDGPYVPPTTDEYNKKSLIKIHKNKWLRDGLAFLHKYLTKQMEIINGRKGIPQRIRKPEWLLRDLDLALINAGNAVMEEDLEVEEEEAQTIAAPESGLESTESETAPEENEAAVIEKEDDIVPLVISDDTFEKDNNGKLLPTANRRSTAAANQTEQSRRRCSMDDIVNNVAKGQGNIRLEMLVSTSSTSPLKTISSSTTTPDPIGSPHTVPSHTKSAIADGVATGGSNDNSKNEHSAAEVGVEQKRIKIETPYNPDDLNLIPLGKAGALPSFLRQGKPYARAALSLNAAIHSTPVINQDFLHHRHHQQIPPSNAALSSLSSSTAAAAAKSLSSSNAQPNVTSYPKSAAARTIIQPQQAYHQTASGINNSNNGQSPFSTNMSSAIINNNNNPSSGISPMAQRIIQKKLERQSELEQEERKLAEERRLLELIKTEPISRLRAAGGAGAASGGGNLSESDILRINQHQHHRQLLLVAQQQQQSSSSTSSLAAAAAYQQSLSSMKADQQSSSSISLPIKSILRRHTPPTSSIQTLSSLSSASSVILPSTSSVDTLGLPQSSSGGQPIADLNQPFTVFNYTPPTSNSTSKLTPTTDHQPDSSQAVAAASSSIPPALSNNGGGGGAHITSLAQPLSSSVIISPSLSSLTTQPQPSTAHQPHQLGGTPSTNMNVWDELMKLTQVLNQANQ